MLSRQFTRLDLRVARYLLCPMRILEKLLRSFIIQQKIRTSCIGNAAAINRITNTYRRFPRHRAPLFLIHLDIDMFAIVNIGETMPHNII